MKWLSALSALFFPDRCVFCGKAQRPGINCCDECAPSLPRITPPVCPNCGWRKKDCGNSCRKHTFSRIVAPFYYEGPVKRGIWRFKFQGHPSAARYFGRETAETIRREYGALLPDVISFVPLSGKSLRRRGYDQARLIAAGVGRELQLPVLPLLEKCRDTKVQHTLPLAERRGNVIDAYRFCGESLQGRRVLLIDDISTTGATLNECAKMLKIAGAGEILAAVIALRR